MLMSFRRRPESRLPLGYSFLKFESHNKAKLIGKSESKKFKLCFKWLILFMVIDNNSNIKKLFIQKATVCVYRFIQTV